MGSRLMAQLTSGECHLSKQDDDVVDAEFSEVDENKG